LQGLEFYDDVLPAERAKLRSCQNGDVAEIGPKIMDILSKLATVVAYFSI
jgi:hypothetical protein